MSGSLVHELPVLWLGGFLGALLVGAGGFGFALGAASVWLHGLPPVDAAVSVLACSTIVNGWMVWVTRRMVQPRRLLPFLLGGAFGIPVGIALLTHLSVARLKETLGVLLISFGIYAFAMRRPPIVTAGGAGADAAIGFLGGVLGGLAGLSGVVPTLWTQLRGWPRDVARGVYQPFIVFVQAVALGLLLALGAGTQGLLLTVVALPSLALGSAAGWAIYGRIDEALFRRGVATAIALSGLALIV